MLASLKGTKPAVLLTDSNGLYQLTPDSGPPADCVCFVEPFMLQHNGINDALLTAQWWFCRMKIKVALEQQQNLISWFLLSDVSELSWFEWKHFTSHWITDEGIYWSLVTNWFGQWRVCSPFSTDALHISLVVCSFWGYPPVSEPSAAVSRSAPTMKMSCEWGSLWTQQECRGGRERPRQWKSSRILMDPVSLSPRCTPSRELPPLRNCQSDSLSHFHSHLACSN